MTTHSSIFLGQVALRKTNNDDFAALLILTCPEDTDAASKSKAVVEDSASDSNEAKEQRFLDFFRDLGEQYWGWQVSFMPSSSHASKCLPFCSGVAGVEDCGKREFDALADAERKRETRERIQGCSERKLPPSPQ